MGQSLPGPVTDKTVESGAHDSLNFAMSAIQGWRVSMEDAHCIGQQFSPENPEWLYFGVFDGHAGKSSSIYCSNHLLTTIVTKYSQYCACADQLIYDSLEIHGIDTETPQDIKLLSAAAHDAFIELDNQLRNTTNTDDDGISSGTTALVLIITPAYYIYANCGDSRAILTRDNKLHFSTKDHKPSDITEKTRIQKAGGSVYIDRVNGNLAVSRALGDFGFKNNSSLTDIEQAVSPQPTITVIKREPSDNFTLLACDGIWDVFSNETLSDLVLRWFTIEPDVQNITNFIIDACLYLDSRDNMTCLLISLPHAPELDSSLKYNNTKLDEDIRSEIEKILSNDTNDIYAYQLVRKIQQNLNINEDYILFSKISYIIEVLNKLRPDRDKSKDYASTALGNSGNQNLILQQVAARYGACFLNNEET